MRERQGLCLGPTGLEKALGGVGLVLRLSGTEGAQVCLPPLVLEGRGPHLGTRHVSWAQVGGANALRSSSSGVGGRLPPDSLFLCQSPSYAPRTSVAQRGPLRV